MATITFKGNPIKTSGELPTVGSQAPDFSLLRGDLSEANLATWAGKRKVLNIFPSLDTPVCALSVQRFNKDAANFDNTVVLNVSADLPFAQKRFCAAEGIENAETLSTFRSSFGSAWGVEIAEGPLAGLTSRAVVILDGDNKVTYTEQVPEIAQEPDYDKALAALK
jgi:thiol peroxidase